MTCLKYCSQEARTTEQKTKYIILTNGRRVRFLPIYSRLAVDGKETLLVNLHQLVINNLCLWLKTIQL